MLSTIDNRNTNAVKALQSHRSVIKQLSDTGRFIAGRLTLMLNIYGERRCMENLSDDMLKDLGISRAQLNAECRRSLTDIPENRK